MLDSAINKRTFTMVLWRYPVLSGAGQPDPILLMQSPNGLEQIDKTPVIPEHVHNGFK